MIIKRENYKLALKIYRVKLHMCCITIFPGECAMNIVITVRIREVRKAKGLTIAELEQLSGVSRSHISEIETRKQMPTLPTLCRIAGALNIKPEELYTFELLK